MEGQFFSNLIEFSWTLCAFLYAGQGWFFLQEFKGNRIPKKHFILLSIVFLANTIATSSIFILLSLVPNESLSESNYHVDAFNQYIVKIKILENSSLAKKEKKFNKGETMATALEIDSSIMELDTKKGRTYGKT